jgi:hypothetical protein
MKRISFLFLIVFLGSILISSCSNSTTYAEQLKSERLLIAAYIKRNNINVISKLPTKFEDWGENNYYLSTDGLYFHLVDSGDVDIKEHTLVLYDVVVPRYKEYTLDVVQLLKTSNWSTIDYPRPSSFIYGNTSQSCTGFHEAASYMKRNNSVAKIIMPSKIGFYSTDLTSATPYFYDLKIKIQ